MSGAKLWFTIFILFLNFASFASGLLFDNGKTDWKIYVSPQADDREKYAAEELQNALKKISGADFEVVSIEKAPDSKAIIIGDLKNPEVLAQAKTLKLERGNVEEIAVYTLGNRLYLAGNNSRGTLYAVYSFLQNQLGVRWLWPGADGEFMPAKTSWALPDIAFNRTPSFAYRGFHLCGDRKGPNTAAEFMEWEARNFMNYNCHAAPPEKKRMGFYSVLGGHSVRLPETLFKEHPEYFAENNGKRSTIQICFSNPEALRLVTENIAKQVRQMPYLDIIGIHPSDNPNTCRCKDCAKMDPSTGWFEFYNRMTDALKKEFPNLKFTALAYSFYRDVPKCQIRNCEFVQYASYDRCNIHPYGHPDCKDNENELRKMLAWKETGLPMGDYTYEHDVFVTTSLTRERSVRFLPFLSMIDNTVKTYRKLGHVAIVPEAGLIGFLPKYKALVPSKEYMYQLQHRLTFYLYARLLWDSDQNMTDILRDWCQTAFGAAAVPMYDYYLSMDRAWGAMPTHRKILGGAGDIASLLLAGKMPEQAASAFASAEKCLSQIADPTIRDRVATVITRERILFKQWQNLYYEGQSDDPRQIALPLQSPDTSEKFYSSPKALEGGPSNSTLVSLAWIEGALLVKWVCHTTPAENLEEDSVQIVLSDGVSGETWYLSANSRGDRKSCRESRQGVRDDNWNPDWQLKASMGANAWEAEMTIPFASLGQAPNPTESWEANFVRQNAAHKEVFPVGKTAWLFFSVVPRTDQLALWWLGFENSRDQWLKGTFDSLGYKLRLLKDAAELPAQSIGCSAYWFQNPDGSNKIPDEYWGNVLVPAVKNGAVAVFASSGKPVPIERYFNDPSFAVQTKGLKDMKFVQNFLARRTQFIAPGDWSLKPNNLQRQLKGGITPEHGIIPAEPKEWTVLATMPLSDEETCPYILVRPYGKGLIALTGVDIKISRERLLDNLVLYNKQRTQEK